MNMRTLVVLVDGEPGDSTLVRAAREYADANGCSITLLRVLPEVTRASRTDRGALILPWQAMQLMKAGAKFDLELMKERLLDDRALPTKTVVRFGDVIDEVAATCYAAHPKRFWSDPGHVHLFRRGIVISACCGGWPRRFSSSVPRIRSSVNTFGMALFTGH